MPSGTFLLPPDEPGHEIVEKLLQNRREGTLTPSKLFDPTSPQILTWKGSGEKKPSFLRGRAGPLLPSKKVQKSSAVTYSLSGGRLGDNLIAYFHGKWIAMLTGLPFLYTPFNDAEKFNLIDRDPHMSGLFKFKGFVTLTRTIRASNGKIPTLFTVPYFPECLYEFETQNHEHLPKFEVDWEDPIFQNEVRKCLAPKKAVNTLQLPEGYLTVALHIRRGGQYESFADGLKYFPLKFPPDSYYLEQLERITRIFPGRPIYAHIFTDDLHPETIAANYSKYLKNQDIKFGWKPTLEGAQAKEQLLEDFYSMGKFDCIVRCMSNFSIIASQLGNYNLMVTPLHCIGEGEKTVVDQIELKGRGCSFY